MKDQKSWIRYARLGGRWWK